MKKFIYILIVVILLISNETFADESIDISLNNTVIDNVTNPNYNNVLYFWRGFPYYGKFDLFKINFPETIKIEKSWSRIQIPLLNSFILEKSPKLLDFLIEKMWKSRIKKFIANGTLHIIWDRNKINSPLQADKSNYYLANNENSFTWKYLEISKKYKIYSEAEKAIKLTMNPFDKDIFYWYFELDTPYPLFSIFDNSLLPQDLNISVSYNNSEFKSYSPKIKYNIQPYIINTPYDEKSNTKKSYVFMPSYESEIKVPKGISIIEVSYKKYIPIDNYDEWISIEESY